MQNIFLCFLLLLLLTIVHADLPIGKHCTSETVEANCGSEFVCRNNTCQYCIPDSNECPYSYVCKEFDDGTRCVHKNLFPNFNIFDALASIVSAFNIEFMSN